MENTEEQQKCPKCGSPVTTRFCGNCGLDTENAETICPVCGKSNPWSAKFCAYCAMPFDGTETTKIKKIDNTNTSPQQKKTSIFKRMSAWIKKHKKPVVAAAISAAVVIAVSIPLGIYFSDDFRTGKVNKVELGMTRDEVEKILGEPDSAANNFYTLYWMEDKIVDKYNEVQELLLTLDPEKWEEADRLIAKMSEKPFKSIMVRFGADKKVSEVFLDRKHVMGDNDYSTVEKEVKKADLITYDKDLFIASENNEENMSGYYVKYRDGSLIKSYANYDYFELTQKNKDRISLRVSWKDNLGEYMTEHKCKVFFEITNGCFTYCKCINEIDSITIPDGVTSIGEDEFNAPLRDCTWLKSITIPDSVTSIGMKAFFNCTELKSIIIPDSVTEIGVGAFGNCTGLTNITIPDSVLSIRQWAFSDCTGLTSITIPNSVTEIGREAFSGCTELTSVTIPEKFKNDIDNIFYACGNIEFNYT